VNELLDLLADAVMGLPIDRRRALGTLLDDFDDQDEDRTDGLDG